MARQTARLQKRPNLFLERRRGLRGGEKHREQCGEQRGQPAHETLVLWPGGGNLTVQQGGSGCNTVEIARSSRRMMRVPTERRRRLSGPSSFRAPSGVTERGVVGVRLCQRCGVSRSSRVVWAVSLPPRPPMVGRGGTLG